MDCSLPGSSVHGIFQARVLEWGAIAFSLGKFIPKYFILFVAMVNGIVSLISLSIFSLLVYRRRRQWHPTPLLLPGKSHGRRSLVGCNPWGREESDTTERLHFHFSLSCIGEGNGNPLQCSYLEIPRDGGAWWAAIYEVTQSRTRLKRLSSIHIYPLSSEPPSHLPPHTTPLH